MKQINEVIKKHRFVKDRVIELEKMGFQVEIHPLGSGGVGQVKEMLTEYRVQIGYGRSRYNYAYCVIIKK